MNIMIIDVTFNVDCWWIQGDIVTRKKKSMYNIF